MNEMRELTDTEVESVCGGISDLGKYITKAVGDAISAAIGDKPGNGPGVYPQPAYSPKSQL
ncbi:MULTISPECIES: hypothetical protein [unclassified Bradyrhizobium]|uniref:hypothetical protein n=1 Tax=unclassified Bradyrhizobium TaxID=2631580 RepID=UPI0012EBEFF7|nr:MULTISPECIES: hypothetical protein [unclassified Bradyrhizobium]MCP3459352.1 hypothetical protein [Bradyrhizobium sp. CCGUVB23]